MAASPRDPSNDSRRPIRRSLRRSESDCRAGARTIGGDEQCWRPPLTVTLPPPTDGPPPGRAVELAFRHDESSNHEGFRPFLCPLLVWKRCVQCRGGGGVYSPRFSSGRSRSVFFPASVSSLRRPSPGRPPHFTLRSWRPGVVRPMVVTGGSLPAIGRRSSRPRSSDRHHAHGVLRPDRGRPRRPDAMR